MHARTRTHAHMHTHARTRTHVHTHARTHACTRTHTHTCTHAHTCTHTRARAHIHAHARTRARTRTHTRALTHSHTHTLQEGHRELLAQLYISVTWGHWGAHRQGCRPPWSGPWLDTAVLKAPLFLRQAGRGGYPNWVRAIANQAHRPSPTRPTAQEGRHSDLWRHLAASSAGVTRDRALSLRSWRQSLVPLVANNGRARVKTAQHTPRPRLPEAPGPHSRPVGRAGLSPCSRASRSLLPGTAGPNPPRRGPFGTVRPLHVQLSQGTPGEARSGIWHCPLVLPALSGRGQEAQVTDSSAHPALDTNRPPKAPGGFGDKRPFPARGQASLPDRGHLNPPTLGRCRGTGQTALWSGGGERRPAHAFGSTSKRAHRGTQPPRKTEPPRPPAIRALPRTEKGLLRAGNARGSHVNGRQPDAPVRAQRHTNARVRPRPPGPLQLGPPGPGLPHPGPSEIPPCGDIQEQNSSSL